MIKKTYTIHHSYPPNEVKLSPQMEEEKKYLVPENQREFWGKEILDANNFIDKNLAIERVRVYTAEKKLLGEKEFKLDENLKEILKTDREYMLLMEVPHHLAYLVPPKPKPMTGANDNWCPAVRSQKHSYGQYYKVGNSWHGPVWAADCTQCHYHYCDH